MREIIRKEYKFTIDEVQKALGLNFKITNIWYYGSDKEDKEVTVEVEDENERN